MDYFQLTVVNLLHHDGSLNECFCWYIILKMLLKLIKIVEILSQLIKNILPYAQRSF